MFAGRALAYGLCQVCPALKAYVIFPEMQVFTACCSCSPSPRLEQQSLPVACPADAALCVLTVYTQNLKTLHTLDRADPLKMDSIK